MRDIAAKENDSPFDGLHHRSHEKLKDYWRRLKGARAFPRESDIDPDELADIWQSCFLISMDEVTRRMGYRYSYLGENLIAAYGNEILSMDAAHLTAVTQTPMRQQCDELLKTNLPVIEESEFVNASRQLIRYRTCMLPLGNENDGVTHILGCMRWRPYRSNLGPQDN